MLAHEPIALFNETGARKYICASELARFLDAAHRTDPATRALCCLLAFTGCRISEALALTSLHIDTEMERIVFRSLKRRKLCFRTVPIPPFLIAELKNLCRKIPPDKRLWSYSRQTAWRRVKAVMDAAGIAGPQAMPKGLRHGFGIATAEENVPMPTTQKWLGHACLETTAIYQQAVGREEHAFAKRLWRRLAN